MPWLTRVRASGAGRCGRSTPRLAGRAATPCSCTSTAEGSSARDASVSRRRRTSASAGRGLPVFTRREVTLGVVVTRTFSIKRSGRHQATDAPRWARSLLAVFRSEDIRNLVFLPDTVMGRLLALAEADPFFRLVGVHREEEAVGILTGLFLGGQRGAMLA